MSYLLVGSNSYGVTGTLNGYNCKHTNNEHKINPCAAAGMLSKLGSVVTVVSRCNGVRKTHPVAVPN